MPNPDSEKEHYSYDRASSTPIIRAVLKGGETLKPFQRAGVFVVSMMIIAWGVVLAMDAIEAMHNDSPRYLLVGAPSLFLIVFGLLGFRNALRFKKGSSSD
jgi:hypothetical protein